MGLGLGEMEIVTKFSEYAFGVELRADGHTGRGPGTSITKRSSCFVIDFVGVISNWITKLITNPLHPGNGDPKP